MQTITPFLWFDGQAEEAANFYVSVFTEWRGEADSADTGILRVTRYGAAGAKASGRPEGSVMTVEYQLDGQRFTALNGGPEFRFTEAVSFMVNCADQDDIDFLWSRLSEGGEEGPCGWLKDRYGLSWQITPVALGDMTADEDPARAERAMSAMLQMGKIDLEALNRAYEAA
jgi:predicted 3-demethylubiquinone-9 3-methyltransferase (glyoxalase superfamily)